jgi:hypothetical protein
VIREQLVDVSRVGTVMYFDQMGGLITGYGLTGPRKFYASFIAQEGWKVEEVQDVIDRLNEVYELMTENPVKANALVGTTSDNDQIFGRSRGRHRR